MEALVAKVQETSTITVIGTFTAGTSTSVNMVIEGADVGNITASDAVAYTVTNVSGF
jgi:phosphotransacetylase